MMEANSPDDSQEKNSKIHLGVNRYWEDFDFSVNNTNSAKRVAFNFYVDQVLMSAISDAFLAANKSKLTFKDINKFVFSNIPVELYNNVPVNRTSVLLGNMIRIGYVEVLDKNTKTVGLTDEGIKAMQDQVFKNAASSAFFNYQALLLNKRSFMISMVSIIVAILSLVVALIALTPR